MNTKQLLVLALFAIICLAMFSCRKDQPTSHPPPSSGQFTLSDFETAKSCSTCHPQYFDEWEGSMHRYSTHDPIWMLASNSLQRSTQGRLKDWCFQCHAPLAFVTGNTKTTEFQFADLDSFVREGITCDFCHVLRPPYLTTHQRIQYNLSPGRVKYGTMSDPIPTPAHDHGYDGEYGRSNVCRMCHDLVVNNVPVEITNTEWQNSPWGAMSVECQQCHMATYTGRAAVGGPIRTNLHRHTFVGVDVAITDFPNKPQQRAEIDSLLKNAATMYLDTPSSANVTDSVSISVTIYNDKTGHNLPTSVFFNRQMWIEVTFWNGTDTTYRSGYLDGNKDLMAADQDKDLVLFGGTLYKNGQPSNVFELDSLVNNSLAPFESRTSIYRAKASRSGTWNVRARLLFRPFGPYLFRALDAGQYVTELPIFEMQTREALININ